MSASGERQASISVAMRPQTVYAVPMMRISLASIAILLGVLPALALAAPAHKRPLQKWHGYGFLPGYHQPPNDSVPAYDVKGAARGRRYAARRHWYIDPTPEYLNYYDGEWHYFGRPGFHGGHYNGGSFGPCWTRTPIGAVWNCG